MKKRLPSHTAAGWGMTGALASVMLLALPVHAQDDSRLSLADRVARLEQQAQSQSQGGTGLVNQIQQLQSQIQQQQGQIEELQHQLQQQTDSNKAQYTDLDSRLGKLESGGGGVAAAGNNAAPAAAAAPGKAPASQQPPAQQSAQAANPAPGAAADQAGAQAAYDTAFKALRGGDYVGASRGFRGFIQQYPDSPLAPNAFYWLGESYYVTMNYQVAMEAFQTLLGKYPQSEKAPDAMLKLGYTQYELKQVAAAKATLQSVTAKYPGSKAAGLAQERLRRLQSSPN